MDRRSAPVTLEIPLGQSSALDQRIAAALAAERQVTGRLGAHALTLAFCAVAVWCALVHPWPAALYYLGIVAAFVALACAWGWRSRRPVPSWLILGFVLANAILLTVTLLVPNPFVPSSTPVQMALRPPKFLFFLLLVAWATFTLSPGLVIGAAFIVVATWSAGVGIIMFMPDTRLGFGLPEGASPAEAVARYLDPTFVDTAAWACSVFTACLIAGILAVVVGRMQRLVDAQARLERARANLARHVSANLVEELAAVDEPFGPIRTQEVAVLFVDIVGFTRLCEGMSPTAVMTMLRGFHGRMADCVFRHGGTLDKFIGDSVMATFGTPDSGPQDAVGALACGRAMLAALDDWNDLRTKRGEPPLRVGIGLHFGPVVLGDIGDERRVEFAVLGDTVNVASRLETLTRELGASMAVSQALVDRVLAQAGRHALSGMRRHARLAVRGRAEALDLWILPAKAEQSNEAESAPLIAGTAISSTCSMT
ncbi:MAG TPA: adenylate/guanylate cyclase domain-containing protein [Geminicoccus sp.]|uniref:adenylate/guanylate cyclase domain-containing protein n=1 Tax=Geminicoccus sp. TaxID=2024832 RepID=UPI002CF8A617|nr:adenylate/guanylate cyclase domain-containing protein [Geminicoccus sp.]HWL70374.1 adenylate/guanylate cyclase domain-containing protein [Geminicoccus sp.]